MKNIINIITVLTLLLGSSCTRESIDDCRPGLRLHYFYTMHKYEGNLFEDNVDLIHVYVFDKDELYYDTFIFDDPALLHNDNSLILPLPAGDWKIVSWGGDLKSHGVGHLNDFVDMVTEYEGRLVKGGTTLEHFRLSYAKYEDLSTTQVTISEELNDLYHGEYKEVTTRPDIMVDANIGMVKTTNTLVLRIKGANNIFTPTKATERDEDIHTIIPNERFNFDHSVCEFTREVKYVSPWSIDQDGNVEVAFKVLRLMEDDNTGRINILSPKLPGGKVVIPVVQTILRHPDYNNQTDIDKEDTYYFELEFNQDLYMTLTVNDWKIINITPEK